MYRTTSIYDVYKTCNTYITQKMLETYQDLFLELVIKTTLKFTFKIL